MKNKRTIILTAITIVLFRCMMLMGAKFFVNSIETGNEISNSLTAEIQSQENVENTFDYPYFKVQDIEDNREFTAYNIYKEYLKSSLGAILPKDEQLFYSRLARQPVPDENMVTYQQAANTCGEALKYLYGITYHTNEPAMIWYLKSEEWGEQFRYIITDGKAVDDSLKGASSYYGRYITINVDAYTGKVTGIFKNVRYPINIKLDPELNWLHGLKFTDDLKEKVVRQLKADLEILGMDGQPQPYDYQSRGNNGFNSYTVYFKLPDGIKRYCNYITTDNVLFELSNISIRATY